MCTETHELYERIDELERKVIEHDDFIDYLIDKMDGDRVELYKDYENMVRNYDIEYED